MTLTAATAGSWLPVREEIGNDLNGALAEMDESTVTIAPRQGPAGLRVEMWVRRGKKDVLCTLTPTEAKRIAKRLSAAATASQSPGPDQ